MVKGNWERRAELANIRRSEAKAKKLNRNTSQSIESILNFLSKNLLVKGFSVQVWLENDSKIIVCRKFLRCAGICDIKKCRRSHETSTISIRGFEHSVDDKIDSPVEYCCDDPINLEALQIKDYNRIRFITVDNVCIYDYLNTSLWTHYRTVKETELREFARLQSNILGTVLEVDENDEDALSDGDDENIDNEIMSIQVTIGGDLTRDLESLGLSIQGTDASISNVNKVSREFMSSYSSCFHKSKVFGSYTSPLMILLTYLTNEDLSLCFQASRVMTAAFSHDPGVRRFRRELHAAAVSYKSKAKKEEKKKKIKAANVKKSGKKDGFARGNGGGR